MLKYVFSMLFLVSMMAFAEEYVVGKDYTIIQNADQSDDSKDVVRVTEFFSYGCPWCYHIEAGLNRWVNAQGNKIDYTKIPVVFNKDWEYYAKAYYIAKALSLEPKLTPDLFKSILKDKRPLNSNQTMIDYLTAQGVNPEIVKSAFNHSPSIDIKIDDSNKLMRRCQIDAVPALVVNYKYKTDMQMAKTEERLFGILDYLVAKAAKRIA